MAIAKQSGDNHTSALVLGGKGQSNATARLSGAYVSGTTKAALLLTPEASAANSSINYQKLVAIGDVTGTTAYGFGDTDKPTTGVMASFGRTAAVGSSKTFTDTGADIRAINKLDNSGGTYTLQGAYIKAKNYSGAKLANLVGLFVECVADGTISGTSYGIKIGSDGTVPTADILFSNGLGFVALATAITANSTTTSMPIGSIAITSHATGRGKIFQSDGSKWQYAGVS